MHTPNSTLRINGLACAFLLCAVITHAATPPSAPPISEAVVLTGWLHVEDYTMADVVVTVDVNGVATTSTVKENGRFDLVLPADAEAVVRFEKPGHLPKEVVVDTRHARAGDFGQRTRHVKFAVIMQLERHMAGLTYPGPVGTIGFDPQGGCTAISHDRRTVKAKRNVPMVF